MNFYDIVDTDMSYLYHDNNALINRQSNYDSNITSLQLLSPPQLQQSVVINSNNSKQDKNNELTKVFESRKDDHKFIEEQSEQILSLVKIIDAYDKENITLKEAINYQHQICSHNQNKANKDNEMINYYSNIEVVLLIVLFLLLIYSCFIISYK